jgi:hypothetical protein
MTASIRRGQIIVVASLLLLVAFCFFMYYAGYHLGQALDTSTEAKDALYFLFAAPLFALGGWWTYPRSKGWILAAYGLLALLCAFVSVRFFVVPLLFGDSDVPGFALGLMASAFAVLAALFTMMFYVLAFSASVRDYGNYCRDLKQKEC